MKRWRDVDRSRGKWKRADEGARWENSRDDAWRRGGGERPSWDATEEDYSPQQQQQQYLRHGQYRRHDPPSRMRPRDEDDWFPRGVHSSQAGSDEVPRWAPREQVPCDAFEDRSRHRQPRSPPRRGTHAHVWRTETPRPSSPVFHHAHRGNNNSQPSYRRPDPSARRDHLPSNTAAGRRYDDDRKRPWPPESVPSGDERRKRPRQATISADRLFSTPAPLRQQIEWGKQITRRDSTIDSIFALFEARGQEFEARNLATAAHRIAKISRGCFRDALRDDRRMRALAQACRSRVGEMNAQELANSAWAFATAGVAAQDLFEAVASIAPKRLCEFKSQELANTVWAFAKAGVAAQDLFEAVATAAPKRLGEFNSQDFANTVWAFATAGVAAQDLFEAVATAAPKPLGEFNAQGLANTVWAFATAGVAAQDLFEAVATAAPKRLCEFNAQNLANTAWAFATAGVAAQDLFGAIATAAPKRLGEFNSQDFANTVWAFATAGVAAQDLFEAVASIAPKRLCEFKSQQLANTVWAFATAGVAAQDLFEAVATAAPKRVGEFNAQGLANTVWAFATAGVAAQDLFEAVATAAPKRLGELNAQELANTVWAFATAGVAAQDLFEAVATVAPKRLGEFSAQNLANTVWAFATAGVAAQDLFEAVATAAIKRLGEFSAQNLANTVWAFAVTGSLESTQVTAMLRRIAEPGTIRRASAQHLSQFYQFVLFVRVAHPQLRAHLPGPELVATMREAITQADASPSQLQREVSALLSELGWSHRFEHVTIEGLSLDLAQPSAMSCVEVDGPSHYLRDTKTRRFVQNGSTRLKTRLLEGLGWTVTRIPFFEWDRLTATERRTYLATRVLRR